jgi:hypothetical protein
LNRQITLLPYTNLLHKGCVLALKKLEKYYDKMSPILLCAAVLDPNNNMTFIKNIWPGEDQQEWRDSAKDAMLQAFDRYSINQPLPPVTPDRLQSEEGSEC